MYICKYVYTVRNTYIILATNDHTVHRKTMAETDVATETTTGNCRPEKLLRVFGGV